VYYKDVNPQDKGKDSKFQDQCQDQHDQLKCPVMT